MWLNCKAISHHLSPRSIWMACSTEGSGATLQAQKETKTIPGTAFDTPPQKPSPAAAPKTIMFYLNVSQIPLSTKVSFSPRLPLSSLSYLSTHQLGDTLRYVVSTGWTALCRLLGTKGEIRFKIKLNILALLKQQFPDRLPGYFSSPAPSLVPASLPPSPAVLVH